MEYLLYVAMGLALLALVYAFYLYKKVMKNPQGSEEVINISGYIKEGANAFLKREYFIIIIFAVIAFFLISISPLGIGSAIAFILGALFSALAGIIGMKSATNSNSRTATAAKEHGMKRALGIAFKGGAVMGMCVVGFGLLGVILVFTFTNQILKIDAYNAVDIAAGYSLGASSIALFGRVGGGIFTKAADVGADLVGKIEAGIPEDDPRNPAVIADNVGDNVGDVAGMGSDLLESYVSSIIGASVIGALWFDTNGVIFVLIVAAFGVLASILGSLFVRGKDDSNPHRALKVGTYASAAIFLIVGFILNLLFVNKGIFSVTEDGLPFKFGPFYSLSIGLAVGLLIAFMSEYYTSSEYKYVKEIAKQSETGHATNIISGLAIGMRSTAFPVIFIAVGTIFAYMLGGLFGIGLAAVGMLGTAGMTVSVDAYGPIADNAGGIAQMSKMDKKVRAITDELDSVGNTTAAIAKGFAIGSASLTALALFGAFTEAAGLTEININNPKVIAGLMIGGMLAFLFSSLVILSVGKAANKMIDEVRRQFKEMPGIMTGADKPDYAKCVTISTDAALKEMIFPAFLAIATPLVVGFLFGAEALGGLLAGTLITGIMLAIFMANSGGAWDNAKKYIELDHHGGHGSDAHKASITGDTVGDPFKDTAGPAIDILIKLMTTISLVFAALFGTGII